MIFAYCYRLAVVLTTFSGLAVGQVRWQVDPKPIVDIAATSPNGDVVFERAAAAIRLVSGTIVVADNSAAALRFVSESGQLLGSVGRKGNGPAEFQRLWWIGECAADTVFAWDLLLRRMTVVTSAGSVVRQYATPGAAAARPGPGTVTCSQTGTFAFQSQPQDFRPANPGLPVVRGMTHVFVRDARGQLIHDIGDIVSSEMVELGGEKGPRGGSPRPLGRTTSVAVSAKHLYIGTADSAAVDVYALDSSKRWTLPINVTSRKASNQAFERAANVIADLFPARLREKALQELLLTPVPDQLPPYSALLTDTSGTLWVVLSAPGDARTHLRALAEDGRVLADVDIPAALTVFEVGQDYIVGSYQSPSADEHILVYRLRRIQ